MRVTVRLGGSLAGTGPGERAVRFPAGATLRTLLGGMDLEIPESAPQTKESLSRRRPFTVLLNGRNIEFLGRLDTPLSDEDVVAIFPASDGG